MVFMDHRPLRILIAVIILAALCGPVSGCASLRMRQARQEEDLLVAAGFVPKVPRSAKGQEQLNSLKPYKMYRHLEQDGNFTYFFTDPRGCNCAYVGNQQQYSEYRRLALQKKLAEQNLGYQEWSTYGPPYWSWDDGYGFYDRP